LENSEADGKQDATILGTTPSPGKGILNGHLDIY
jgi:hypothetical protein